MYMFVHVKYTTVFYIKKFFWHRKLYFLAHTKKSLFSVFCHAEVVVINADKIGFLQKNRCAFFFFFPIELLLCCT